jgi:MoaA/NifB/PqqE/SkfB family radical SAM enzyme
MRRSLNVILDVTSRCNLKCVMCYFANTDRLSFPPYGAEPRDGNMPLPVFEKIAAEMFPRAWRVALGCAAEPMIHPGFREILSIAGRYGVPDLWFPTNLLALTPASAQAMVDARVRTVAASIDGTTRETYEKIRVPAKWERLLSRLELLREVRRSSRGKRPRLRIIFTWMKSNRKELADLPAFAEQWGADELDVRYVSPTVGVDVGAELLSREDPRDLNAELAGAAKDAVRRGLRLSSYPEFESRADRPRSLFARARRRLWLVNAGIDRWEHRRHAFAQRLYGCAYPDRHYVIRPNGAVAPCIYWEGPPIGVYPAEGLASISRGAPLARIRDGLRSGEPVGTCATCGERRTALYRLRGTPAPPPASQRLPTHPK